MNFPLGMAIGLAMGVTIGIASGRKRALEAIVAYALMRGVVLHDASGAMIGWEDFLREAVQAGDERKRPLLIALAVLGVGVMLGILAYVWWYGGR